MKYCAFLRGVNVNGTAMKMAAVCEVFAAAGMQEVSSVLATGNILFSSAENISDLKQNLEKVLSEHFKYEAFLFLKTENEVAEIFKNNPFPKALNLHFYAFVGNAGIEQKLLDEFNKGQKTEHEAAEIIDDIFYWQVPKGNTLDSGFGKVLGKKTLKPEMTSRNINTIEKIVKKL